MCVCVLAVGALLEGGGKKMKPGAFMWGKVGLLSVGELGQESCCSRKLEQPSPALHLDKINPSKKKKEARERQRKGGTNVSWCVYLCVCLCESSASHFFFHFR